MNRNYFKKVLKLSCVGGATGMIYYILAIFLSNYIEKTPLIADVILGGILFIPVGLGIVFSIILLQPQLKDKKKLLLVGGGISSFIAGIFFMWGIAVYVSIVIFPIGLAITIKLADLKSLGLRIIIGGIIGGIFGIFLGVLLWLGAFEFQKIVPNLRGNIFDTTLATLNTMIIIYFLNLGILVAMWQGTGTLPLNEKSNDTPQRHK